MAIRRAFLTAALLAVTLFVLLPAAAMAAQWLPGESREASGALSTPPRVASDATGNSVAVWLGAGGEVNAAFRPRGGPWGGAENLETEFVVTSGVAPRVAAMPNGEFVAAWLADRNNEGDDVIRTATRSTSGAWSAPDIVAAIGCCPGISALEAGGDGSVTVVGTDEGQPTSYTRPDGGDWGEGEFVPTGSGSVFDAAPDGSLVAVRSGTCSGEVSCIEAAYRPPGGPWDGETVAAGLTSGQVTGLAVAAGPDSTFTAVWGEGTFGDGLPVAPGRVRSSDRSAGPGGSWEETPVADLPTDVPGCPGGFGCIDVAIGDDGTRVAVWQQFGDGGDRISAAVREAGQDWGTIEQVGAPGSGDANPTAGVTTGGIPVVSWAAYFPVLRGGPILTGLARGAHRADDGTWDEQNLGTATGNTVYLDDLAVDGEGNALTAWTDSTGTSTAGFDGAGPRFTTFSLPSGPAGQSLAFSATADDNWSAVTGISWLFGDGTGAGGATTSHTYGAPGAYTATATATDEAGNETQRSGIVGVGAAPTPEPTATPDPCGTADTDKDGIKNGCDDNNGAARPEAFKTVNATVVSGEVFVKLPAGAARASQAAQPPKGFVRLEGAETIPVGATLDTGKGRVRLRTASDTRKHVQTADFFRGRFVVRQVRQPRRKGQKRRSTKLITEIFLSGSSFRRACGTTTASISQKRRRSKKRVRRLFGDGKGTFRTRGRNAAATVRGTRWSVQDRCDGTLVTVQRGRVEVRDLVKRKTVIVRTGKKYLARRR